MKVRITPYLCKEERTKDPIMKYKVCTLIESTEGSGVFDIEDVHIGDGYISEAQAEEAARLYRDTPPATEKDI